MLLLLRTYFIAMLIIVTGHPASGKTTIGKQLAVHFGLPYLSKDDFKEVLFDELGYADRAHSKRVGKAAYRLLFEQAAQWLAKGEGVIMEANFKPEYDDALFAALLRDYRKPVVQVLCTADGAELYRRFEARALGTERHPGHADRDCLEEWKEFFLDAPTTPLQVGTCIEVDTTIMAEVHVAHIIEQIEGLQEDK